MGMDFPGRSVVKNPPANAEDARDVGSIPGMGRYPGEGNGNPFQYSFLGNPMDRGAWWATVNRIKRVRDFPRGQWLSLCVSTAEGPGSIPSWGMKFPHTAGCSQKENNVKIQRF